MHIGIIYEKSLIPIAGKKPWEAMKKSLIKDGHTIHFDNKPKKDYDFVMMWGVQFLNSQRKEIWDYYRSKNIPILVMEVGVIKREILWRIGWNGIDNTAWFNNHNCTSSRWDSFNIDLKPWKTETERGQNIYICLQHTHSQHWPYKYQTNSWLIKTISEIRKYTNRKIYVRPHPRFKIPINIPSNKNVYLQNHAGIKEPHEVVFKRKLNDAWCIINPSSNPGIECLFEGIPSFTEQNSLAVPCANHKLKNIEKPYLPDRTQWVYNLAYCEWSVEEIEKGIPWDHLKSYLR